MRSRALLLAALILPLASFATAAPPAPRSWAPYEAVTEVRDLAISAGGTTIAAALAAPPAPSASNPLAPPVLGGELSILDVDAGFAFNATSGGSGFGRNFTALSHDGVTIASVGLDPVQGGLGGGLATQQSKIRLYGMRLTSGDSWSSTSTATFFNATLDFGYPVDLVMSADGTSVALASQQGSEMVVQGFTLGPSAFNEQFRYHVVGNVTDIAATPDLATIAVAGRAPSGNDTFAHLAVLPFSNGATPTRTHLDRTNNTSFLATAITADGSRIVAGDARGMLHVFTAGSAAAPLALPGPTAPVTRVLMADDGARIAAVMGQSFVMLNGSTAPPSLIYNVTHAGSVTDAAGNRTLGLVVLAVNGTGVVGYGDASSARHWVLPATGSSVALDAAGTHVAYAASATRVSAARVPRGFTFTHTDGLEAGPIQGVRPQGSVTFQLQVNNTGGALERVRFEADRVLDLSITADPPVLVVEPDRAGRVNVTVHTGPLFSGTRSLVVSAVSLTSGLRDETNVSIQLQDEPEVRFLVNDTGDIAMKPGESRTLILGVLNNGSSDAAIGIRATQTVTTGAPWDVQIDPASLTLAPNSVTTVRAVVKAPADGADGTSDTVRFTLEGTNVSDSVSFTFRINPTLGVLVEATGRVKFVEPGQSAYYNVTVTNTGSLPRRFEAFYEATPQGGKTWAVDMDTSPFRLEPGRERTIQVRVFAPQDATPNVDRVSVFVRARSFPEQVNETLAEGNLTLFANAVPPKPTTTTTTPGENVPGPAVGVILLSLVGVALLHRRRRP